jgi:hypothetical protein
MTDAWQLASLKYSRSFEVKAKVLWQLGESLCLQNRSEVHIKLIRSQLEDDQEVCAFLAEGDRFGGSIRLPSASNFVLALTIIRQLPTQQQNTASYIEQTN